MANKVLFISGNYGICDLTLKLNENISSRSKYALIRKNNFLFDRFYRL